MSNRHHPHPVIVDNSKDDNALGAFSQEARQAPRPLPPPTPSPVPVPPRLMHPIRPAMFGLAALVGVAVAAVTLLSFTLGRKAPSAERVSNRDAVATLPTAVGSTGPLLDERAAVAPPSVLTPVAAVATDGEPDRRSAVRADIKPVAPPAVAATVGVSLARRSTVGDPIRNTRVEIPTTPETVDARPAVRTTETPIPVAESASIAAAVSTTPPRETKPVASETKPVASMPAPPIDAPAPPAASASAVAAAVKTATGRTAVESVLQRYATAFSTLDARAAKGVWPSVNEGGLARAFSTIKEQQIDLGACDIWVTGPTAVASCEGRARYTPKVGSNTPRSEPRGWTFYLEQDGQQWSIASVVTR